MAGSEIDVMPPARDPSDPGYGADVPAKKTGPIVPAVQMSQLQTMVVVARGIPRAASREIANRIIDNVTFDEETADDCLYSLKRKSKKKNDNEPAEDKPIEGPSIRLAEIAFQQYGNCIADAHVLEVNREAKYVEAVGEFHDLESNTVSRATVRRSIRTSGGYVFSDDMINVTSNAACAIAKRNAILAGIPFFITQAAYRAAKSVVTEALKLPANRRKAIDAFKAHNISSQQIVEHFGLESEDELSLDNLATLRGMFGSLQRKEATVNELFGKGDATERGKPDATINPLKDDDKPKAEATATPDDEVAAARDGARAFHAGEPREVPRNFDAGEKWLEAFDAEKAKADKKAAK